nr:hypothetical protein CFP56_02948 [Quercus suber]
MWCTAHAAPFDVVGMEGKVSAVDTQPDRRIIKVLARSLALRSLPFWHHRLSMNRRAQHRPSHRVDGMILKPLTTTTVVSIAMLGRIGHQQAGR